MLGDSNDLSCQWQKRLEIIVRRMYEADATGHDYYHSIRVKNLVTQLQKSEGGDLDILVAAAYLHDVGRVHKGVTNDHALVASEAAPGILAEIDFSEDRRQKVVVCIRYHDHYAEGLPAEWRDLIELQIFQDADRLDAIGAIGIARTFTYGGATTKPIWVQEDSTSSGQPPLKSKHSLTFVSFSRWKHI
jgi:uncharacterized protein